MSSFKPIEEWEYEKAPIVEESIFHSENRVSGWRLKRYLKRIGRNVKNCEQCGNKKGSRIGITVHHTDGNHLNNHSDNLEILCGKCHDKENKKLRRWKEKD